MPSEEELLVAQLRMRIAADFRVERIEAIGGFTPGAQAVYSKAGGPVVVLERDPANPGVWRVRVWERTRDWRAWRGATYVVPCDGELSAWKRAAAAVGVDLREDENGREVRSDEDS
jgi:hypothetical protein